MERNTAELLKKSEDLLERSREVQFEASRVGQRLTALLRGPRARRISELDRSLFRRKVFSTSAPSMLPEIKRQVAATMKPHETPGEN